MKINQKVLVQVDAKVLDIHMKVCDRFSADLFDSQGNKLKEYEGYVPEIMPEQHHGDYLILKIDIDTGMILNWKTPSAADIEKFINEESE